MARPLSSNYSYAARASAGTTKNYAAEKSFCRVMRSRISALFLFVFQVENNSFSFVIEFITLAADTSQNRGADTSMNRYVDSALHCHVALDRLDALTIDQLMKETTGGNESDNLLTVRILTLASFAGSVTLPLS